MPTHTVECLRCGSDREVEKGSSRRLAPGECPRCGYLGWAEAGELDEPTRRRIRERPPERRGRLYAV